MNPLYTFDSLGIFTGLWTMTDIYAPVPIGTETPPPELSGTEVAQWNGAVWNVLSAYPEPVYEDQPRKITKLAFRNRFSTNEKIMLELASLDNPTADMAQRQQAAALRVHLADTSAALFVDLIYIKTREGVQMLEAAGLLSEGRALEILDAPILLEELFI